jgi:hypothetical protein
MNTEEWAKAFIKEHNIPVGTDINIEEYIKMSEGKIKKNKKYWKQQAESWREIAEMETESANHWAGEYYLLNDEFEELELKFDILKRELNTLRQYNIGKKQPGVTHSNDRDIWNDGFPDNKPVNSSVEAKVISLWSKNIPKNPSKKKCNCKSCNCDK